MRNLLALLLFVPSLCLAQLPEFVSETGLAGWYGFNNNFNDSSLGDNHGVSSGASFTSDRFGEPNAAASIEVGSFIDLGMESNMVLTPQDSITIAFWSHPNNDEGSLITKYQNGNGSGSSWYIKDGLSGGVIAFGNGTSGTPNPTGYYNLCPNATSDWTHITVVFLGSQVTIWLNGAEVCTVTMPVSPSNSQPQPVLVGRSNCPDGTYCNNNGSFAIDELGLWERALTAEEIQALFLANPLIYGCTDQDACNFQSEANADDGSCVSCEVLASACGEGTVWDSTLQECVTDLTFPTAPCGEGTVWDPVNEECIIAIPADLNYDGCVTVNDLLVLLAVHGTCPPYPEWPDEPTDTTWTCGDPLTYWDYDYATVLIGDQCWFAENLATTQYTDGTVIDSGLSNSEWASTTTGAQAAYDDDEAVVSTHGRLYNGYAVDDTRGLCPTNWSVPTDSDFIHLEENLGMSTEEAISLYWRGSDEGQRLKSTTWQNGLDEVGFSALPYGGRNHSSGNFLDDGAIGYWWTKTFNIDGLFYRRLDSAEDRIFRTYPSMNYGFSVRCIKD